MTLKTKNSVKKSDLKALCGKPEKLVPHLKNKLAAHRPQAFVFSKKKSVPAAVLIPLYFKNNQAYLLFTKRTEMMERHKGQIAFPGGRRETEDADLETTALRETEEEVGIRKSDIEVLGRTDRFLTNTYFMVTPYVGLFDYPYPFVINKTEIERLIEVPLIHLLDKKNFEVKPFHKNGYAWMVHYYHFENDLIWGVTGFLLSNFLSIAFDCARNMFTPSGLG